MAHDPIASYSHIFDLPNPNPSPAQHLYTEIPIAARARIRSPAIHVHPSSICCISQQPPSSGAPICCRARIHTSLSSPRARVSCARHIRRPVSGQFALLWGARERAQLGPLAKQALRRRFYPEYFDFHFVHLFDAAATWAALSPHAYLAPPRHSPSFKTHMVTMPFTLPLYTYEFSQSPSYA